MYDYSVVDTDSVASACRSARNGRKLRRHAVSADVEAKTTYDARFQ